MILSPLSLEYKLDLLVILRLLAEYLGVEIKEAPAYASAYAQQAVS